MPNIINCRLLYHQRKTIFLYATKAICKKQCFSLCSRLVFCNKYFTKYLTIANGLQCCVCTHRSFYERLYYDVANAGNLAFFCLATVKRCLPRWRFFYGSFLPSDNKKGCTRQPIKELSSQPTYAVSILLKLFTNSSICLT